jgi:hypothetical protein
MNTSRQQNFFHNYLIALLALAAMIFSIQTAYADAWKPIKEIKLIVTSSERGYYNAQARIMAKEQKLFWTHQSTLKTFPVAIWFRACCKPNAPNRMATPFVSPVLQH